MCIYCCCSQASAATKKAKSMQYKNNKLLLPREIYEAQLKTINAVALSQREIDVIACTLNGRSAKGTAQFLGISHKTVQAHIYNAMKKLGCASRGSMITLLESAGQFLTLKSYYLSLLTYCAFEKSLKDIAKQEIDTSTHKNCLIVYWQDDNLVFFQNLKTHLSLAGIMTSLELRQQHQPFSQLAQETHEDIYTVYALSDSSETNLKSASGKSKKTPRIALESLAPDKILFLMPEITESGIDSHEAKNFSHINLADEKDYYSLVFSILTKILSTPDLKNIIATFEEKHGLLHASPVPASDGALLKEKEFAKNEGSIASRVKKIWLSRKPTILFTFLFLILLMPALLFTCQQHPSNGRTKISQRHYKAHYQESLISQSIHSDLVIPAAPLLLDRIEIIRQIKDQFRIQKEGIKTVVLVGIGGAGKTTLARQYARSQKLSVAWEIDAENTSNLIESFENLSYALAESEEEKKIVKELQCIKNPAEKEKKILAFLKEKLKSQENWLLIFDNIKKISDIQKYFSSDSQDFENGSIIFTTRDNNFNNIPISKVIQIGELNSTEKLRLFIQNVTDGNENQFIGDQKNQAEKFLNEIPSFPLDVKIAACYLKTTGISYKKYLERLKKYNRSFIDLQENLIKEDGAYHNSRYSIISSTLQEIIDINKEFKDILLFISLLDSQNIPRDLLDKYKSDVIVDNIIYYLKKYSLITTENSGSNSLDSTISLHRSTQSTILTYLKNTSTSDEKTLLLESLANVLKDHVFDIMDKENFPKIKILLHHYEAFLSHNDLLNENIKGSIGSTLGCMYYYLGLDITAKKNIEENLILLNKNPDKNALDIANSLSYLGTIYRMLGEYDKAKSPLEQSLRIYKAHFQHPTYTARALAYLGIVYWYCNKIEEAKSLLKESLLLYKKHSEYHVGSARALAYLGMIYRDLGDLKKSINLLENSLLIYEKHPEHHVGFAWTLVHLAYAHRELGNYQKSKELLEKSIKIYKAHFSESYIDVGWALMHLGDTYTELGMYEQAKNALEQGMQIKKKYYPEDHPDIAWALVILGGVYQEQGDYERAKITLDQSLIIYRKHPKNTDIAWALTYLGNVHRSIGDYEKAQELLEEGLIIHKNILGEENVKTAWVLVHLARIYKDIGDYNKAQNILEKCLPIYEGHFGKDHIQSARILSNLGEVHVLKGDLNTAEVSLKRALSIIQHTNHPDAYVSLERLAYLFKEKSLEALNKGEKKQADEFKDQSIIYIKQALEIVRIHFPTQSPHVVRIQSVLKSLSAGTI
jgi:tetratricopeptide (TPR) repeat protein/DNA-binding CsgD family transcriptional regulator